MQPSRPAREATEGWRAELSLRFEPRGEQTRLVRHAHRGPLRVQRPFHPEGDGTCHVYLLHPPGGVVGHDQLHIEAAATADTRGLVTTPGAGKLYRSHGKRATVHQELYVQAGAQLEWLPQETIAFCGAHARLHTRIELEPGGQFFGWELLCLGRPACDESFDRGRLSQRIELFQGGELRWLERSLIDGGSPMLRAPWGLRGRSVLGTLVCAPADAAWLDVARAVDSNGDVELGVSFVRGLLVARVLADGAEQARAAFESLWRALRPLYAGSEAVRPRVWNT